MICAHLSPAKFQDLLAFTDLKLHRIEINLRPENAASARVAQKSGYVFEGVRPRFLHIAGEWRDHLTYVAENPNL